jgi:lipoate---protein ligase
MRFIDLGECSVQGALALEEAVLESVDAGEGQPAWITWRSPEAVVVLGTARRADEDLCLPALERDSIAVLRRRSGGGSVVLGPASPAVTLIDRSGGDIGECYRRFCTTMIAALARVGLEAEFHSPADLACAGRKVAGLAQRRKQHAALTTGSLLVGSMAAEAEQYLAVPEDKDAPEYRAGRAHDEFMTSLQELGIDGGSWPGALSAELSAAGALPGEPSSSERERAALIEAELARREWVYRL